MRVPFDKYNGGGNDFILIDDRDSFFPLSYVDFIPKICHRSLGVGADGLILLQRSLEAHFQMRIFNSDGSEPTMCGNGMRCLIAFLRKLGWEGSTCSIQTGAGILLCQIDGSKTSIHLGAPRVLFKDFSLLANHWKMDVVDTGVPHGVIFVEDIDLPHLIDAARPIRFDSQFSPDGINVNFAEVLPDRSIAVRTYERGVEGETMSCGTGSAAVAWLAAEQFSLSYPITIRNNKRVAQLEVCYSKQYGIGLKGEATHVFEGFFNLDSNDLRSGA